jgi:hypothetical protein
VEVEGDGEVVYSRSATAWLELRSGGEVSDVALGTDVDVVEVEMEAWSRVHQP